MSDDATCTDGTEHPGEPTDEEFTAIEDVAFRWTITLEEAEAFLAAHGYFAAIQGERNVE